MRKAFPFYIVVIAIFLGIVSPHLFSEGMFMDGLLYATIAHNLAHGIGSFWDLHLTQTLYPHFHEHPPLAMGMQSLFFRLFGDAFWIERLYSVLTFAITGIGLFKIGKEVLGKEAINTFWVALLFWITVPLVTWSASNNMLENTMMVFIVFSVLHTLKAQKKAPLFNYALASILLFFAVLTKGVVALFPLSIPFWTMIFSPQKEKVKEFIINTFLYTFFTLIPFVFLFVLIPESKESLWQYVQKQIVGSINNVQTVSTRFYIIGVLFQELLPMLIIGGIVYYATKKITFQNSYNKTAYIFIALGLSGVLPIMVSLKQSGFYILATFPFFAIGFWLLIYPQVVYIYHKMISQSYFKQFKILSYILLCIAVTMNTFYFGTLQKDKEKLTDVKKTLEKIPPYSIISLDPNLVDRWDLHGYYQRYAFISLDAQEPFRHQFALVNKKYEMPENYKQDTLTLKQYNLYIKKDD